MSSWCIWMMLLLWPWKRIEPIKSVEVENRNPLRCNNQFIENKCHRFHPNSRNMLTTFLANKMERAKWMTYWKSFRLNFETYLNSRQCGTRTHAFAITSLNNRHSNHFKLTFTFEIDFPEQKLLKPDTLLRCYLRSVVVIRILWIPIKLWIFTHFHFCRWRWRYRCRWNHLEDKNGCVQCWHSN